MTVNIGHINPIWDEDFKNFPYTKKQGFSDQEIEAWEAQGYHESNLKSFTGWLYDNSNPMPDWISSLEDLFALYRQTYTFYRMDTLEIMPVHIDHFRTYSRLNNTTPDKIYRVLVMLEDWKPGHYLEIDGVAYVNWKAGDWFKWSGDTPHAAANIGIEPRYTLQITGMPIATGQFNKLFKVNIPDVEYDPDIRHPMIRNTLLPHIIPEDEPDRKVMIHMRNNYIQELDDINHGSKIDDYIHIHLFEPMCSYLHSSPPDFKLTFYSEFPHDVDPMDLRSLELDSIYNYAKRNDLKVKVYTGDYNADKYYPYYSDRLELICDDLFLRGCVKINNLNEQVRNNFTKKFISLNWRFTKHRQMIATYLASEDGYLSWYHNYDFDALKTHQSYEYIDVDSWEVSNNKVYNKLKENCEIIKNNSPFTLDVACNNPITIDPSAGIVDIWPDIEGQRLGYSPSVNNKLSNGLEPYYKDIFVDIVTESRFAQPTANISEKVLQAIQYQKPFILVAPPHSLEYLRTLGFKTYNYFWDESYDKEENHELRMLKIFNTIDSVLSKSIIELREMYSQMIPIVRHNLNVFKNLDWNRK